MDENINKDLGLVTAYAYALSKGYTGTEDEFAELMASYADVGQTAVDAALRAKASEEAAKASETASKASELAASTSASSASTSETNASQSASVASTKASEAASSASEASSAASTATTKASEASQSASSASESATAAQTAKTGAEAAQEAAETAQEAAETAETHAKASETAAASSATSASNSATTATTKASEAAQSATDAGTSATNAANSATAASGSASTASTKASQASQSATDAANSATAAGTAKTDAETAKTAAQTAQTAAETAQGKAEDAQAAAEAAAHTLVIDTTLTQPNQAAEAKATGDAISQLKSHLNATEIVDTASGAIATFPDGSDGVPVESLTVSMEPIQDLHGQDAPYPAGGGKNFIDITGVITVTSQKVIATIDLKAGTYSFSCFVKDSSNISGTLRVGVTGGASLKTGTISAGMNGVVKVENVSIAEDASISMIVSGNSAGYNYAVSEIQCESGSTATAYAPYSNICPISGRQSMTVTGAGKNLFDESKATDGVFINANTGAEIISPNFVASDYIKVLSNADYYTNAYGVGSTYTVSFFDANKRYIGRANLTNAGVFNTGDASYVRVSTDKRQITAEQLMLNYPSTDTAYHAYNGQQIEVQLGQTVYGGTVDVTTGEMTISWAYEDIKANVAQYSRRNADTSGQYFYTRRISDCAVSYTNVNLNQKFTSGVIVNPYEYSRFGKTDVANVLPAATGSDVRVGSFGYDTLEDWVAYVQSQEVMGIAYTLAEPITVTLTPEQLTTVLGTNNVWSDADSVSVDYVADTKLYIQKAISAAVAALS